MSRAPAVAGVGRAQDRPGSPHGHAVARVPATDVNEACRDRAVLDYPSAGGRRGHWGWRRGCVGGWQRGGWQGGGGPRRGVGPGGGGGPPEGEDAGAERGRLAA